MNFYVIIRNRIAEVLADGGRLPLLVCGNTDNRIVFTFDEEWSDSALKTARFVYREDRGQGELVYRDVAFSGDTVTVPLFENITEFWVGVIAEDRVTTSAARIACLSSIDGLTGKESGTESVRVALSLGSGDQVVTTVSGRAMSSVTIVKPSTLIPENIREGVVIAGVVGTCTPKDNTLGAPTLFFEGTELVILQTAGTAESYDLYWSSDANGFYYKETVTAESGGTTRVDVSEYLTLGQNYFYVTAKNETTGETATVLDFASYTVLSELTAPTISLENETLCIVAGEGTVESYDILYGTDANTFTSVESVSVEDNATIYLSIARYLRVGENYFRVAARNETTGEYAATTEYLSYTLSALTAPTLSTYGTTLVIKSGEGLATKYLVQNSEDNNGFTTVTEVSAVTGLLEVDVSAYLAYEKTYFTVRAVNEWTGETATTLNPVYISTATTYNLVVTDYCGEHSYYSLRNGSEDYILNGYYDAIVSSDSYITNLTGDDSIYLAPVYDGGYSLTVLAYSGCKATAKTKYVVVSNFTADAAVTIRITPTSS